MNGGRGMSKLFSSRFSAEFQPEMDPSRHFTHTLASLIPYSPNDGADFLGRGISCPQEYNQGILILLVGMMQTG